MFRRVFTPVLNFVFPPTCAACDGEIDARQTPALCGECWDALKSHDDPQCLQCGTRVDALFARSNLTCGACLADPPAFSCTNAPFPYAGTARDLVLGLKHGGRRANAKLLASYMAAYLPVEHLNAVLVPVPLHPSRLRSRGFNQSQVLAAYLSKLSGIMTCQTAVRRKRATNSQGTMGPRQRARNVAGAFEVANTQAIQGKTVILIDDVVTSGATMRALSKVIKKADPERIQVLAATRALPK